MNKLRKYLIPGFIFQSITIGGGYGTGRELVQFFLTKGPLHGLGAMLIATILWSLVLAATFELARMTRSFDYRTFLHHLLGKAWWAYEFVYVAGMILVISVLGSAAGELLYEMIGTPKIIGILIMMVAVGVMAFAGSIWIEKVLSFWSLALYAVYFILLGLFLSQFSDAILNALSLPKGEGSWVMGGIEYAAYNVGIVPAILFVVHHFDDRKDALISGMLAGPIAMLPGLFIYLAMLSQYPQILPEAIPANYLIGTLDLPIFQWAFQIILFGTLIETGVGLIHGFNERIASVYAERGKKFSNIVRLIIAQLVLGIGIFLADAIGLIDLIAKGYTALTWGYWLVFVIPVLTYGGYRIFVEKSK